MHCVILAELREQQRREVSRPSSVSPVLGDVGVAAAPIDPYLRDSFQLNFNRLFSRILNRIFNRV